MCIRDRVWETHPKSSRDGCCGSGSSGTSRGTDMLIRSFLIAALIVLAVGSTTFTQDYVQYVSRDDRFTILFPTQPKVTETTFTSQYGYCLLYTSPSPRDS